MVAQPQGSWQNPILEKLMQNQLNLDDTFRFHCTGCGKCCKHREDILLNPYDLNRIARHLNIEAGQVIQDYCVWYVGKTSRLPVVAMNMLGAEQICPFLERRRCKIHAAKPTVCALYPLGRVGSEADYSVRYILQDVRCGTEDEEHTIREWLADFGLEESEEWFREWQKTIMPLSNRIRGIESHLSERQINQIGIALLNILYASYDNERNFMEQFKGNARKVAILMDIFDGRFGSKASLK